MTEALKDHTEIESFEQPFYKGKEEIFSTVIDWELELLQKLNFAIEDYIS